MIFKINSNLRDISFTLKLQFLVFFTLLFLICDLGCFVVCLLLAIVCASHWDSLVSLFDYSWVISLVWTTNDFSYSHWGFYTLKYWHFLVPLPILFAAIYLLLILISSYKFEEFYFRCVLICYCVLISHHHIA